MDDILSLEAESKSRRSTELALMVHYITKTAPATASDPSKDELWASEIPNAALQSNFLLYPIYAVAALHRAHTGSREGAPALRLLFPIPRHDHPRAEDHACKPVEDRSGPPVPSIVSSPCVLLRHDAGARPQPLRAARRMARSVPQHAYTICASCAAVRPRSVRRHVCGQADAGERRRVGPDFATGRRYEGLVPSARPNLGRPAGRALEHGDPGILRGCAQAGRQHVEGCENSGKSRSDFQEGTHLFRAYRERRSLILSRSEAASIGYSCALFCTAREVGALLVHW